MVLRAATIDVAIGALALLSLIALVRFKINRTGLAGAILGLLAAEDVA